MQHLITLPTHRTGCRLIALSKDFNATMNCVLMAAMKFMIVDAMQVIFESTTGFMTL